MLYHLLDKKDRRQFEMIELFRQDPSLALTYQDLADRMDCSVRTVQSDLEEIQELFTGYLMVVRADSWVRIHFSQTLSWSFYFQVYSRQCLNYNLLLELFKGQEVTIDDLAESFFVSRSSIYRAIRKINRVFQELDLPLTVGTSPFGLVGEEIDIRTILPQLMMSYYSIIDWPFVHIDYDEAINLVQLIASYGPYLEFFLSIPCYYVQAGVNFERYASGHPLKAGQGLAGQAKLQAAVDRVDSQATFEAQGQTYLMRDLLPQILAGVVTDQTLCRPEDLRQTQEAEPHVAQALKAFQDRMAALKEAYGFSQVTPADMERLAINLYNLCQVFRTYLVSFTASPQDYQLQLLEELGLINPDYMEAIWGSVQGFVRDLGIQLDQEDELVKRLVCHYILLWPETLQRIKRSVQVDILVYTGNINYDREYQAIMERQTPDILRFHVSDQAVNWHKVLSEGTYQGIMSSYHLPAHPSVAYYYIQALPDVTTFTWLNRILNQACRQALDASPPSHRLQGDSPGWTA